MLDASAADPSLDTLYRVALTQPFECFDPSDENKLNAVRFILGAIVVAQKLFGLKLGVVHDILLPLGSFAQCNHGQTVQVSHVSCIDMPWRIDKSSHHDFARLAEDVSSP